MENSLNRQINRLSRLVGRKNIEEILSAFEAQIAGWKTRSQRLRECKTLTVMHTYEVDGG
jgi:hypothetical protein